VIRALDAIKRQAPEIDFHETLRKITTKQESRRAKSLVERANRDLKQVGILLQETLDDLKHFAAGFDSKVLSEKEIAQDGVTGVLFYGR